MNLCDFLHFNDRCPICDEPLTLYMQWINSICWKGVPIENNLYRFNSFIGIKDNNKKLENEYVLLWDNGPTFKIEMSSSETRREAETHSIYFFYLCNSAGFKVKTWGDYEISLYRGCYYRSTPLMEFYKSDERKSKDRFLKLINPDNQELINKDESYSFKDIHDGYEKVYMINLDYEDKKTTLWHYSTTTKEREAHDFSPKLFNKDIPLLTTRIKAGLEDREKLLSKLNGWILMS